ncbi:MAG: hypothetical protein DWQ28_06480 [Proteobacteria bacterium]|nr:MAG: hypothetical protein DWQ28_06175 [Pseudomonadota bacterium]REJ67678.1 MAG: hypothetical protein DWQ28_06480 [Pseudomonadota bacterium]|tara:strand:+ start:380 stop:658 length:279 start_codon:yes stop_codon:yes gene_type:complete
MNEHKIRQRQDRAAKAEALLRNELFIEAFEYLDEQFVEAWKTSGVDDAEAREKMFHLMQALGAVKGYFQSVVEDGKLAQVQLDEFQRYGRIN